MSSVEAHLTYEDPVVQLYDMQRNGKKIFLGRLWELPNGFWRWESYFGDNKNDEPNKEAAMIMLETVARDLAKQGLLTMEDAV